MSCLTRSRGLAPRSFRLAAKYKTATPLPLRSVFAAIGGENRSKAGRYLPLTYLAASPMYRGASPRDCKARLTFIDRWTITEKGCTRRSETQRTESVLFQIIA